MSDNEIESKARIFREAIEIARDEHKFDDDESFIHFPTECCGLTCSLLAKHLFDHYKVETLWISAERDTATHAWLVLKDCRISDPHISISVPDDIATILMEYNGTEEIEQKPIYSEENVKHGLIIDITADQFDDFGEKVFVGCNSSFHNSFDFIGAHEYEDINDKKLNNAYEIIESVIKDGKYG